MVKRLFRGVALCGWLIVSATLQAHHALEGIYDLKTEETVSGTLVQFQFANPHGSLTMSVKNADGTTRQSVFTTGSATSLAERGVGRDSHVLKAGDQITAKYFPARRGGGSPLGFLKSITTAGGTTLDVFSYVRVAN